jgi:hypothetical protein
VIEKSTAVYSAEHGLQETKLKEDNDHEKATKLLN